MLFNINKTVRVKLTDAGRAIHCKAYDELVADIRHRTGKMPSMKYYPPKEDAEGWSEWQLWTLMQQFGPFVGNGWESPFEMEIEIPEAAQNRSA